MHATLFPSGDSFSYQKKRSVTTFTKCKTSSQKYKIPGDLSKFSSGYYILIIEHTLEKYPTRCAPSLSTSVNK